MRTFLALGFSVGTTRRIAEAMEKEVARLADAGGKLAWVPPARMHVTLKFFGKIPPESLDGIVVKLRQRLVDLAPLALRARGYGVFPEAPDAPRVLWVGIDGGKPLAALHQAIEDDMDALGFPREPRAFRPHLTVARVLEPAATAPLVWQSDVDFGEEKIPELLVYETQPEPVNRPSRAGAEYLVRARIPFRRP